jgi:serine/threonine protein kinase
MKYTRGFVSDFDPQLVNSDTGQVFARKLLRLAKPDPRTAKNELRAIKKLCNGMHRNIITVFECGELPDLSHTFIDMELCSVNLYQYSKGMRTALLVHDSVESATTLNTNEIWTIVTHIADALTFIHSHHEIHRDLKPQNGASPPGSVS